MSTIPTNAAFKKITSNNITDDYIQLIRGSDKTVLLWVDALGVIHAPNSFLTDPGGPTTGVQINNAGSFYSDAGFIYNPGSGVVSINPTAPVFAAPTVTPAASGSATWGYVIVARQGIVDIATSPQGTTSTGATPLTGVHNNLVSWVAVPGATAYDIFLSTSGNGGVNPGYLTTVTTTSYIDTGSPTSDGIGFLSPPEAGFVFLGTGLHGGNSSWKDIRVISPSTHGISVLGLAMDSPFSIIQTETSAPANHGGLTPSSDFAAGNFFAYANGSTRTAVGLNALAISNTGAANGLSGLVATAINNEASGNQTFVIGVTAAAVNNSIGNILVNAAYYASTTNNATVTGSQAIWSDFYGDVFTGIKAPSNIGKYATFYAAQGAGAHSNAGAATLTAAFYSEDTGLGSGDWSFYSVAGKNFFGGQIQSGVTTGTAPFVVASTTNVANLNASSVNGQTVASGTTGHFAVYSSGTAVGSDAHLDDGVTLGSTITCSVNFNIAEALAVAGQSSFAVGSLAAPSISFAGSLSTTGIWSPSAGQIAFAAGSVDLVEFLATAVRIKGGIPFGWTNGGGVSATANDTGLSRDSAAVIDVGNGSQGDKSGTINLTTLVASGSITGATATVTGATPTGTSGQVGFGTTTGFGNGSSGTAVTTTAKGTGTGPTNPQTVVNYLEVDIAGVKYWMPLVQ